MFLKSGLCMIGILGILGVIYLCYVRQKTNRVKSHVEITYNTRKDVELNQIPKILWMTYPDKDKIPQKVYTNLVTYASDYDIYIYDDRDGLAFLKRNFDSVVVDKYTTLSGAHKADLLRYCLLYVHGGVYMDIKTELIRPLSDLLTGIVPYHPMCPIISVLSNHVPNTIYQGVIATPPRRGLFLGLIQSILQTSYMLPKLDYLVYVKDFHTQVKLDVGTELKPGLNIGKRDTYYLFEENCSTNPNDCYDGLDKYGLCCFISDGKQKVIKTRYADYPWKDSFFFKFLNKISRPEFWAL
jgi:hypothetical protein